MMSPNEIALPLQATVLDYFAGERREMLLILGGSTVLAALAIWLWFEGRSAFAMGFMVTVLFSAALMASTAGALLVRDKSLARTLVQQVASSEAPAVIHAERERIGVVASKYRSPDHSFVGHIR